MATVKYISIVAPSRIELALRGSLAIVSFFGIWEALNDRAPQERVLV